MPIKKIAVIGAGTMGAQISVQIANHGYKVTLYSRHPERFQKSLRDLTSSLKGTGRIPAPVLEEWLKGAEKVKLCTGLQEALREVDLVVEAVSEDLELKRKIFARIDSLAPQQAILSTTSSTVPVSRIEDATQRRVRCLNLHFYQAPMLVNMVDIMGGPRPRKMSWGRPSDLFNRLDPSRWSSRGKVWVSGFPGSCTPSISRRFLCGPAGLWPSGILTGPG